MSPYVVGSLLLLLQFPCIREGGVENGSPK
jgi:hypothetical protein